ncbi:hypothetical protein [Thiothrix eikelboomii]|uniref:hypothetical protein n=1 Tax=Thiothrix eikelboomii TaxID=92487 RepID=UPI003BAFA4D6
MTMFLIQSLLWLLAAFLLGYGLARWFKGRVCKRKPSEPHTRLDKETSQLRVPVTTAAIATGTAAAASLATNRESAPKPAPVQAPTKPVELNKPVPVVTASATIVEGRTPSVPTDKSVKVVAESTVALELPKAEANLPKVEVKAELPKVELPKAEANLPKVEVKAETELSKVDLPKVDLTNSVELKTETELPKVDLPKVDLTNSVELKTETELSEADLANVEVKDIKTGVVGLGSAALAVAAVKLNAPDGEVDLTVTELIKPPDSELDLKTLQMNLPTSNADLSAAEWHNQAASVDVVAVNVPQVTVDSPDLPDLNLPPVDVGLAAANLQTPEGKADLTALRVDLPDAPLHVPTAGIDLEHAKLGAGLVELNTPEGLYTLEGAQVAALDHPEGAVAIRLTKPDGDVQLAAFATDPSGKASLAAADSKNGLELQTFELGSLQSGLVNQEWLASLKAAAVAQGNTILAGAADQALTQTTALTSTEIGSLGAGLNPQWLDALKTAALSAGLGSVVAKAGSVVADTPKAVDESDLIERAKTVAVELERANDLLNVEIGTTGQGLNPDFLGSLKTASAVTDTSSTSPSSTAATTQVSAVNEASPHLTVADVMLSTAADTLANQPKPVDESDLIESDKNLAEAVLNPTGLTATEVSSLQQATNGDALTGLTLAAASAGTVAAVQANLASGAQPMIVDESDAIEAIKLAWDGELSLAELTALEHSLMLRPGESGRLGLVTCSVPSANCVALGGLEGDLHAGSAMRSKLFDMAVTQQPDGNYVFATLAKWLPGWAKSSDLSAGVNKDLSAPAEDLICLVWDQEPSAVDYAAGYELILREGQYGDLGLVSCAVPATGVVSLGGIEGAVAEGQTAVSKLYGILIERVGEVYTFKQFSKPSTSRSEGAEDTNAHGIESNKVNETLPLTTSAPIEMLEPDLAWSDDQVRRGVQHLIATSQDRRGSKLVSQLWDADSGYDCGLIEGEESLALKPGLYGKLGSIHCGVTKPGRVVVSGDVSALAEGEGVLFHLYNIVVCRDDDDNYRFERLRDLL